MEAWIIQSLMIYIGKNHQLKCVFESLTVVCEDFVAHVSIIAQSDARVSSQPHPLRDP